MDFLIYDGPCCVKSLSIFIGKESTIQRVTRIMHDGKNEAFIFDDDRQIHYIPFYVGEIAYSNIDIIISKKLIIKVFDCAVISLVYYVGDVFSQRRISTEETVMAGS